MRNDGDSICNGWLLRENGRVSCGITVILSGTAGFCERTGRFYVE
jgi:hypothetical protein